MSLTELRAHLRIASTSTAEDTLLAIYRKGARTLAENITRRSIVDSEWRLTLDAFSDTMVLPQGAPLSTVSTDIVISYYDSSGNLTTVGTSVYTIDSDSQPGKIYLTSDQDWPEVYDRPGAVLITFGAGYTPATVPTPIKQWIMVRTGQMFEYREPLVDGRGPAEIPRDFVDGLLDPSLEQVNKRLLWLLQTQATFKMAHAGQILHVG